MKKKKSSQKTDKIRTPEKADLGDFGLEPPKHYRRSQESAGKTGRSLNKRDRGSNENITRSEKRQRETKKRKKRGKVRKVLIWLFVALMLAGMGIVLSLTVFFHIETITVRGETRYSADEVLMQCTVKKGENLFVADTSAAEEMIEQNLPYIYNAEIKRKFPSTLEISVEEAQPAYYIESAEKSYILLDDKFKVLETEADASRGIAVQNAEVQSAAPGRKIEFADKDKAECLTKLCEAVSSNGLTKFTAVYSNNLSDNYIVYDGRIAFKLGSCSDIENKIYQGLAACEKLNETNPSAKGVMTLNGGKQIYFTEE